jgi:hypothetical protein
MLTGLKQRWREFRRGRPGHRFEERFERNRQAHSSGSWLKRFVKPVAGMVLLIAGVVFCLIPGPGLPLLLIGVGLLAEASRPVARAMDWLELRLRNVISRARRWWTHASKTAKYAVIVLALLLASGAAYGGFQIVVARFN